MLKKVTKTMLIAAHDEIDKTVGIEPPIKEELKQEKYEKELFDTIGELDLAPAEIKGMSKATQEVISFLNDKFGKEDEEEEEDDEDDAEAEEEEDEDDEVEVAPPPPAKKGKKPVVVEEEEEEDEEEEEEDEEETSLVDQVNAAKKKAEYIELINSNPEFKKDKKRLLAITSVFSLKKEMLAIVAPAKAEKATPAPVAKSKKEIVEDDDEEEEEEEEAPAKKSTKKQEKVVKEKKAKAEKVDTTVWPAGFAKGDTVSFEDKAKATRTGTLKKYFFHKQSNHFWYIIDVDGKDFYKHVKDVSKGEAKKKLKNKK
jgi:hypothetical protein